ncbi:helix-turn-helix domain-containing protein [Micromonospora profundi]|uniref:helix-turn-helix domain-containing protein n=1 Tax=Micromonospora profundi TaxID=1420889 RepID=UPI003652C503
MVLEVSQNWAPLHGASLPTREVCQTVLTLEALEVGAAVSAGKWLRVGQVAEMLGVSVGTVRNYVDAGKFRRVRRLAAGDRRIWSEDVDAYIRQIEEDQGESDEPVGPGSDDPEQQPPEQPA